jgi:hypothetical protein
MPTYKQAKDWYSLLEDALQAPRDCKQNSTVNLHAAAAPQIWKLWFWWRWCTLNSQGARELWRLKAQLHYGRSLIESGPTLSIVWEQVSHDAGAIIICLQCTVLYTYYWVFYWEAAKIRFYVGKAAGPAFALHHSIGVVTSYQTVYSTAGPTLCPSAQVRSVGRLQ